MKKVFVILLLSICCTACQKFVEKPDGLVPKDKLAEITCDLTLGEQLRNYDPLPNPSAEIKTVFKKHGVTPKQYSDAVAYYTATDEMKDVYGNAQKILEEKYPEIIHKAKEQAELRKE